MASRAGSVIRKLVISGVFAAVVVLLMLWLGGWFHPKVPSQAAPPPEGPALGRRPTAPAEVLRVELTESAVGTVRPVHEALMAAKVQERVLEMKVKAGQRVRKGEVLIRLDDATLKARLLQAEAAAAAARAERDQAQTELRAVQEARARNAATDIEVTRLQAAALSATETYNQLQQQISEARSALDQTVLRAPLTGVVVDKRVDVGDTASPGQVLLTLYDPNQMQMVATVRESLARRLQVGQEVECHVESLQAACQGRVSEIVPEAEAASRSFTVKVVGPCPPGPIPACSAG